MRERFGRTDLGENPGFRAGYLAFYDPLFADRVGAIFREHFPEEPRVAYEDGLERIRRVVDGP